MDGKRLVQVSKYLARHLRHEPARLGLTLAPGGWVRVDDLLAACNRRGMVLSRAELEEVVAHNDKQRYGFDETGELIRANQGHSVDVDLQLVPADPPPELFHGTSEPMVASILEHGLQRMARHHVHLSADVGTAQRVGARHGRPVVLRIDAAAMSRVGMTFYVSANGVWLTAAVAPEFLAVVE